jgi:putative ABC transport system substrate-binding protein
MYRRVFTSIVQGGADGMQVSDEVENIANAKVIAELAEKNRLPAIYAIKLFVEVGGLMSHGFDASAHGYDLADIISQVLKGAKPSEIPVRQATKFELAINLKTAKALGLTVPPELLTTADEVID